MNARRPSKQRLNVSFGRELGERIIDGQRNPSDLSGPVYRMFATKPLRDGPR
jgi:hypothetical protein